MAGWRWLLRYGKIFWIAGNHHCFRMKCSRSVKSRRSTTIPVQRITILSFYNFVVVCVCAKVSRLFVHCFAVGCFWIRCLWLEFSSGKQREKKLFHNFTSSILSYLFFSWCFYVDCFVFSRGISIDSLALLVLIFFVCVQCFVFLPKLYCFIPNTRYRL